MAKVLVKDSTLSGIADSIRAKAGVATKLRPSEMAGAIDNIPTGGGGIELPELTNPAGAENIQKGFEAVNGFGTKIVGTHEEPPALPTLTDAATAADIVKGKEVIDGDGNKITGSAYTLKSNWILDGVTIKKQGEDLEITTDIMGDDYHLRPSATVSVRALLSDLGDATAADVAAGKTFTSAAGVKVTGEAEEDTAEYEIITTSGQLKTFSAYYSLERVTHIYGALRTAVTGTNYARHVCAMNGKKFAYVGYASGSGQTSASFTTKDATVSGGVISNNTSVNNEYYDPMEIFLMNDPNATQINT